MRNLARTHSSPHVSFAPLPTASVDAETPINLATKTVVEDTEATGVVYDESMLRHHCPCQDNAVHLENPSRIQVSLSYLLLSLYCFYYYITYFYYYITYFYYYITYFYYYITYFYYYITYFCCITEHMEPAEVLRSGRQM